MDKFEQQFEDLDVRFVRIYSDETLISHLNKCSLCSSAYMEGAMGETSANSTPAEQVDELIAVRLLLADTSLSVLYGW